MGRSQGLSWGGGFSGAPPMNTFSNDTSLVSGCRRRAQDFACLRFSACLCAIDRPVGLKHACVILYWRGEGLGLAFLCQLNRTLSCSLCWFVKVVAAYQAGL